MNTQVYETGKPAYLKNVIYIECVLYAEEPLCRSVKLPHNNWLSPPWADCGAPVCRLTFGQVIVATKGDARGHGVRSWRMRGVACDLSRAHEIQRFVLPPLTSSCCPLLLQLREAISPSSFSYPVCFSACVSLASPCRFCEEAIKEGYRIIKPEAGFCGSVSCT